MGHKYGKTTGKPWEMSHKWENHRKTIGKPWKMGDKYGKTIGQLFGKIRRVYSLVNCYIANWNIIISIGKSTSSMANFL